MATVKTDIDMTPQFDRAESILVGAGMHPVMARAVIDFDRYGEQHGRIETTTRASTGGAADSPDALLTTRQAAGRLSVSEKQIYRLVSRGLLRSHSFGRRHRFRAKDIATFVEATGSAARTLRAGNYMSGRRVA